jgi:5-methylthioadenosine/S-adenosylhomocysteine deaminase
LKDLTSATEVEMLLCSRFVIPVSAPYIEDGAVLVRDGVISAVGTAEELKAAHPDEEARDFGRSAILPGFVDLHTHLENSVLRGIVDDLPYSQWKMALDRRQAALSEEDWADSAELGALEAIQSGITTIADITERGSSGRAAAKAGLRGVVYREIETMVKAEIGPTMAAARGDLAAWRETLPTRIEVGVSPHSLFTCHPELLAAVSELAQAESLRVSTHLAGSRDEYDFVRWGSSSLAIDYQGDDMEWQDTSWLPTGVSPVRYALQWGLFDVPELLAVHCIQVDDEDIDILAKHDVAVANCARCAAKLGMGTTPLSAFFEHEMRVGIGTDSPASNNTIDFFDEMRIGLLLQRSTAGEALFYTAETSIRMATLEGARALGIDEHVGSLDVGKAADIIAVDLSHSHQTPIRDVYGALVHTANQENVTFTMVDGEVLFEHGEHRTLDVERILERAEEARVKLLA